MNLKSRLQRIQSQLDSGICPLCGTDRRPMRQVVEDELKRLMDKGWSESDARSIITEAVPENAKYLPPKIGATEPVQSGP